MVMMSAPGVVVRVGWGREGWCGVSMVLGIWMGDADMFSGVRGIRMT